MKSPAVVFPWLAVPLAAAAGFYGSHQRRDSAASMPGGGTAATGGAAVTETTPRRPFDSTGTVKKWADRLRNCTVQELPGLFAEIQALQEKAKAVDFGADHAGERSRIHDESRTALRLLCARWAELDAPGGLAFFTQRKEETKDSAGRQWLLAEWALRDPGAAYEAISALPEKEARNDLASVGYSLMEEGKEVFWAWFQKARRPLPSSGFKDGLWAALAADHFEELSAMAAELLEASKTKPDENDPNSYGLASFYKLLARTLAEKDADKAVAWAKEQPESVRGQALTGALTVMAGRSPEKVADYLPLLKARQISPNVFSGSGGGEILKLAVETMASRDPLQALQWLTDNKGKLGDQSYEGINVLEQQLSKAMKEGRLTAEQAFNAVRAVSDPNLRMNMADDMWKGLPAGQLAAAAEWLMSVDSKETRKMALAGIFPAWVAQDREAAMKFAAGVKDPQLAASLYSGLASESHNGLVSTQQERVTAALTAIPPEHRADILFDQVRMYYSNGMMDHSPPFDGPGISKALEGVPPSESLDKAVTKVAETWGASDPAAAMAWASGQSDAGLREKAAGAAMESWAKEDAWGASQWIDAQPAGEQRDIAAHHLARVLRTDEPESAWTWAGNISDPAIRLEAQSAVLRKWRDSSAGDARAAVEGLAADLPTADRQKLTDTLEHRDAAK
ncbi:MAG: hypothetical protein V4726_21040 [Verrucomicrobiota bacterium]